MTVVLMLCGAAYSTIVNPRISNAYPQGEAQIIRASCYNVNVIGGSCDTVVQGPTSQNCSMFCYDIGHTVRNFHDACLAVIGSTSSNVGTPLHCGWIGCVGDGAGSSSIGVPWGFDNAGGLFVTADHCEVRDLWSENGYGFIIHENLLSVPVGARYRNCRAVGCRAEAVLVQGWRHKIEVAATGCGGPSRPAIFHVLSGANSTDTGFVPCVDIDLSDCDSIDPDSSVGGSGATAYLLEANGSGAIVQDWKAGHVHDTQSPQITTILLSLVCNSGATHADGSMEGRTVALGTTAGVTFYSVPGQALSGYLRIKNNPGLNPIGYVPAPSMSFGEIVVNPYPYKCKFYVASAGSPGTTNVGTGAGTSTIFRGLTSGEFTLEPGDGIIIGGDGTFPTVTVEAE